MTIDKKRLYYMTQYANHMSDEGFYNLIAEQVKTNDLDLDLFYEISELMESISDAINQKLFDKMLSATDASDLLLIVYLLDAIEDNNMDAINRLTDYALDDYMNENNILSPDSWEEIADEDLKHNGINANCLYWVKEIDHNYDYLQLNGYENGFYTMSDEDVIHEFMGYYLQ